MLTKFTGRIESRLPLQGYGLSIRAATRSDINLDDPRILLHLIWSAFGYQLAHVEHVDPLAYVHDEAKIMIDDDNTAPGPIADASNRRN